jgi:hypothetical protein
MDAIAAWAKKSSFGKTDLSKTDVVPIDEVVCELAILKCGSEVLSSTFPY